MEIKKISDTQIETKTEVTAVLFKDDLEQEKIRLNQRIAEIDNLLLSFK